MSNFTFDKETHTYRLDGIVLPSITQILQAEGFVDLSKVPQYVLEASQKFGTAAHKACELWDKGILDVSVLSAPLIPYLECWKKFKQDNKITDFLAIEKQMYSAIWRFAGTPDRVFQVNQKYADLFEIKTASELYPANGLQLAAQEVLVEENYKLKIRHKWVVQLNDTGIPKIEPYKEPRDKTVFLSALNTYRWKKENLK